MATASVGVEDLRDRQPPVAGRALGQWFLHRVGSCPPLLDHGVGRHRGHVCREGYADILEIGEQELAVAIDRVVPDVGGTYCRKDAWPRRRVEALVLIDQIGADSD